MPFFSGTGREYDKNKERIKQPGVPKKEKRKLKRLNRRERKLLAVAAGQDKVSTIISAAGQILAPQVLRNIPEYKRRMARGKCPGCGETAERRGYVCSGCIKIVSDMPSVREINLTNQTPKGVKGIPAGQNTLGIVSCVNGHRIFEGAPDCHKGCVAAANGKTNMLDR